MHEHAPILQATPRERVGSRYARRLRQQGRLPVVMYGHGEEPRSLSVEAREALSHIHRGEKVFRVAIDGTEQTVLLKDVQFDHLGTHVVHADFARVNLDERVRIKVSVRLVGEAKGLRSAGAIMLHGLTEVEVECTVAELPEFVEARIDDLDVGHAVTAGEIRLPSASMTLMSDPKAVLAQVVIQQEVKVAEETVVAAEAAAQPEVITARKPEEEGAGEGEAKKGGKAPESEKKPKGREKE
jgi:large subunit ribosomal protein L25